MTYPDKMLQPLVRMQQAFSLIPSDVKQLWIGFSGGLDSSILLHAARTLSHYPIRAIHINHGLQSDAIAWEKHCHAFCKTLAIPLVTHSVHTSLKQYRASGYSPEESARLARYAAFEHIMSSKDCLLTGHHIEDQAETVILQLMRGTGIQGLGGMRLFKRWGAMYHLRPLLDWDRVDRLTYAKTHQIQWIEDASNQDTTFTRNFTRHTILPLLHQRWTKPSQALSRMASHAAEASQLCKEVAKEDLLTCQVHHQQLSIPLLLKLSRVRQRNLLRYWIKREIHEMLSTTQFNQLENSLHRLPTTYPTFHFKNASISRYRESLYIRSKDATDRDKIALPIQWNTSQPLSIPGWGTLQASLHKGKGLKINDYNQPLILEVRHRIGGERIHPTGRIGSHPLSKLFQEWGIPPWERSQWPLIYQGEQLVAVPDYTVIQKMAVPSDEMGVWISRTASITMG